MAEPTVLGLDFYQSPLDHLERMRAEGPVHLVVLPNGLKAWVVTDYAQGRLLLNDSGLTKAHELAAERRGGPPLIVDSPPLSSQMLQCDPPDHTRLRSLVMRAFAARPVTAMRPWIEQAAAELLDAIPADTETDLVSGLASPLPIAVIGELLGVPVSERSRLRALIDTLYASSLDPVEVNRIGQALLDMLRELIARKRAEPDMTLLSSLIEVRDGDDRLSEDELTSMAALLVAAGYESTMGLISSAVLTLLREPGCWAALSADNDLVPDFVEEALRFHSPTYTSTFRFTGEAMTIGETTIPAGETVLVSLLAANHDPARFTSPDVFEAGRPDQGHLAFGQGIHHCLGAQLARTQTDVALRGLLARFAGISAPVDPNTLRWRASRRPPLFAVLSGCRSG